MIIVADNRSIAHQCFHTDAAYASYYRNVAAFVGKYSAVFNRYNWVNRMKFLAVAMSPEKVRLIHSTEWSISQLPYLLEPRYTCVGSIQKTTWGQYFADALGKVSQSVPSAEAAINIVLVSTDMCLLGDRSALDIDEGLDRFCGACCSLRKHHPAARIFILCAIVSENTNKDHYFASPNMVRMQIKLQPLSSFVTFRGVKNSNLHFEEELRFLVSSQASPLHGKLDLPSFCGANCSIVFELHASTSSAQSALHEGLCAPALCGLVPRTGVDAGFIEGSALRLHAPAHKQAVDMLPTENSRRYNTLTMKGFARWLIDRDLLALLRVSYTHQPCPERRAATAEDAIVSEQYWVLIPPVRATGSAQAGEPYWVLLKLVDRDDLLLPTQRAATGGEAIGRTASERAVSPSGAARGADPRPQESVAGADAAEELYLNQNQCQSQHPDPDQDILEDIREYLDGSLVATLGEAAPFNPANHPSGTVNAMFENLRRVQSSVQRGQSATTAAVAATPQQVAAPPAAVTPAPRSASTQQGSTARGAGNSAAKGNPSPALAPAPAQGTLALTSKSTSSAPTQASGGKPAAPPPAQNRTSGKNTGSRKRTIDASFFPELSGKTGAARTVPKPPLVTVPQSAGQGSVQHTMPKRGPGRPSAAEKNRAALGAQIIDAERMAESPPAPASDAGTRSSSTAIPAASAARAPAPSTAPLAAAAAPRAADARPAPVESSTPAAAVEASAPPRFFKRRFSGAAPTPWQDT